MTFVAAGVRPANPMYRQPRVAGGGLAEAMEA